MRILIVEDEPVHARYLTSLLREIPELKIESIQNQKTLTAAECFLLEHDIDLLFLDLNVYGDSGFDLLANISSSNFSTIVVSAYTDRAIKAFEYGVLDFIGKPVTKERLVNALERFAKNRYESRKSLKYFSVFNDSSVQTIPLSEIVYFQSEGKKVILMLDKKNKIAASKKISEIEKILPEQFRRIHKSYLLNMDYLQKITTHPGGKYEAVLRNGSVLPVSRNLYSKIKQLMLDGGQ